MYLYITLLSLLIWVKNTLIRGILAVKYIYNISNEYYL